MKETIITVPKEATKIKVKIDGDNYPLVLKFDNKADTSHDWMENGHYDGFLFIPQTKYNQKNTGVGSSI